MKKNLQYLILFLIIPYSVYATHNRAGEITYIHLYDNTYQFTITTYTAPSSPADRNELILYYGDNTFDTVPRDSYFALTSTVRENKYISIHEYSTIGNYTIYMQDPNRVDGILNISGSVNVPFYLETQLIMPDPIAYGYNSSVQLTNPPIDFGNVGQVFNHNPGAYDPDGDALRFSLIDPRQDPVNAVPDYVYPDEYGDCPDPHLFTIDSLSGDITWNVPCVAGIYVIAFKIEEFRDGILVGYVDRDMQIEILDNANNSPIIAEINDTCIIAGETLNLTVTASDPDVLQTITLTATGGPFVVDESPAEFSSTPADGFVTGDFSWQTTCNHVRKEFYEVVFKVEDDFQSGVTPEHLTDQKAWIIYVIAPAPQNVLATAQANHINVTWDSLYNCSGATNFLGFSIWRKIGCDSTDFGICQTGLNGTGYDSIAFVGDSVYNYTDFAVTRGQIYSYRILAEFGERSDLAPQFVYNQVASAPSNNSCAELKRDVPIINHVSVLATDASAGKIYVQWYPPLAADLDTIENTGPYQYIVKRYEGFNATGTAATIQTFNASTFSALTDTSLIDTLLNTESNAYTYTIDFFSDGNLIGTASSASSVFLNTSPADNKVILTWSFNVPWTNYLYDVYKENPTGSGNYDSIATVSEPTYIDDSIANGIKVCYLIKSYGNYTASSLPADTLINFSQAHCETPVDNEPPCAPVLTVTNVCTQDIVSFDPSDLKNELSWTNPNNSCADDVIEYYIYYASTQGSPLTLLDSVKDANDTAFSHINLESLAGCYAVIAVDSFYNESPQSNLVCVDNCSNYILPNVFTPNGDGANDLYTPILPYRFIDRVDIKIFNRWGALVYKSNDPMINWDGTDITTGKQLNEGVYYYVCYVYEITVDGVKQQPTPLQGYIHLIRATKSQ